MKKITALTALVVCTINVLGITTVNAAPTPFKTVDIDIQGSVGEYNDMEIRSDGLATIAYQDFTNGDIKIAKCLNFECTSKEITTINEPGISNGLWLSMELKNDMPLITYHTYDPDSLKYIKCFDTNCNSHTSQILDNVNASPGREGSDIAIDSNGIPSIAYSYYDANFERKIGVIRCSSDTCTSRTMNEIGSGQQPRMIINGSGQIVMVYKNIDGFFTSFNKTVCFDLSCIDSSTVILGINDGFNNYDIENSPLDTPAIVYTTTDGTLKGYKCGNSVCGGLSQAQILDNDVLSFSFGLKNNSIEIATSKLNATTGKSRLWYKNCQSNSASLCASVLTSTVADAGTAHRGGAHVGHMNDIEFSGNRVFIIAANQTHEDLRYTSYSH